jgi:hypothetical protein
MIDALAKSIVRRLQAEMVGWDVDDFPNAPDRYAWAHQSTTLLVAFEGANYGELQSMSPASAPREVDMSVTVLARSLRGNHSITDALEGVRHALFGWRPTDVHGNVLGFSALRPIRESFVSEEQGVWRFVAMYRSASISVAAIMGVSGAPLTQVNFKDAQ